MESFLEIGIFVKKTELLDNTTTSFVTEQRCLPREYQYLNVFVNCDTIESFSPVFYFCNFPPKKRVVRSKKKFSQIVENFRKYLQYFKENSIFANLT